MENGFYIVYNDGSYAPFDGKNPKENAVFIGVVCDGHTFGVGRKVGCYPLLPRYDISRDGFCQKEYQALFDWDFVKHTEHLKKLGSEVPLKEGEYIPTAAVFIVVANLADKGLNEALEYIGLDPIDLDNYYWFAQRYSARYAWYFSGFYGSLNNITCTSTCQVQAVALWKP